MNPTIPESPSLGARSTSRTPRLPSSSRLCFHIFHVKGQVVKALAPVLQETPDAAVGLQGLQELQPGLADGQQHRPDLLVGDLLGFRCRHVEQLLEKLHGCVQVPNGYSHMVDVSGCA